MKVVVACLLLISLLHAGEIQRIESIVDDISKLRVEYEKCKKSLKKSRQKNIILKAELDYINGTSSNNVQSIAKYKKLLEKRNREIKILKRKLSKFKKNNIKTKKIIQVCKVKKDDNPFPKLVPKVGTTVVKSRKIEKKEKTISFKATVFRLKKNTSIYSSPNSKKLYLWDKDRTFTSNIGTKNWIKITGYFINKKWIRAKDELWIKKNDVSKK